MARYVAMGITRGMPLIAQGGTGTGKSLAYLSGALASQRQVVVAPHTKALQDQLRADLDLIADAFADGGSDDTLTEPPTYGVIKGRTAYVCLARVTAPAEGDMTLDGLTGEITSPSSGLGQEIKALQEWSETTETGDRAEVPFPVTAKAWSMVSTSADDCTGKECPFYNQCFAEKARREAAESDMIIINQSYLAMAMRLPFLLPETVGGIVVDEAHEMGDTIADVFGAQVTIRRLENALARARGVLASGKGGAEAAAKLLDPAADAVTALERELSPPPREPDQKLLSTPRVSGALKEVHGALVKVSAAVTRLPADDSKRTSRELFTRVLDNLTADLSLLSRGATDDQVAWVEASRGAAVMRSARFDVSQTMFEHLVDPYPGIVFTSATLKVAGTFEMAYKQFGMVQAKEAAVTRQNITPDGTFCGVTEVSSPFDYATQSMLWQPEGMPAPNSPEYATAVAHVAADVIRAAGGRTLVLCTSRAAVETISEALEDLVGAEYLILSQRPDEPAKEVAVRFAEDSRAVLVATRSFWTGVSVPGDTCAAVVIDKMPFPSPGDPVMSARSEKIDRLFGKGKGFREVSLAQGILDLVQGAGRLIRTVADRGVVVICDPRLRHGDPLRKSYAPDVLKSLPPFKMASKEEALAFLTRIDAEARDSRSPVAVEVDDDPTP